MRHGELYEDSPIHETSRVWLIYITGLAQADVIPSAEPVP